LPVVAFRAPGPPMMLSDDYLVPRNDAAAMAAKVVNLLRDRHALSAARVAARRRSEDFDWDEIISRTASEYERRLHALRASS
jgi:glycosyltransferase involved in cell wall biosynthesis